MLEALHSHKPKVLSKVFSSVTFNFKKNFLIINILIQKNEHALDLL